jgi:NAD(P)-dependent dehydrogenase (short-subunit alcohol dehydrogenase family)
VTGAGRGLGRTIAMTLAARGLAVAAVSRTAAEVEETATLITEAGGRGIAVSADLTVWGRVQSAMDRVRDELGAIDLLVNNAGACQAIGPSWEVDVELWWGDVSSNLLTTYLCARAVLPAMTERRFGSIVNLGSESGVEEPAVTSNAAPAGTHPMAMTAYGSAKAAVHQFTNQLAREVGPLGVTVVAIRPGPVRTAMTDAIAAQLGVPADSWLPWVDEGQGAAELVWRVGQGAAAQSNGRYIRSLADLP